VPSSTVVLATAGVATLVVAAPRIWPVARHAITLVDEGSHAGVAVLTGRRLAGIRLHSDASGLTVSLGRSRGPGIVATAAAGHVGPGVLGLGAAWLTSRARSGGALGPPAHGRARADCTGCGSLLVGSSTHGGILWVSGAWLLHRCPLDMADRSWATHSAMLR